MKHMQSACTGLVWSHVHQCSYQACATVTRLRANQQQAISSFLLQQVTALRQCIVAQPSSISMPRIYQGILLLLCYAVHCPNANAGCCTTCCNPPKSVNMIETCCYLNFVCKVMLACATVYQCVLQNEASSMSKAGIGKLQNLSVTVQRRWNNVLADSTRQLIIEMFLGLRLNQHFPSARFPYSERLPQQDETDTEGTLSVLYLICVGACN